MPDTVTSPRITVKIFSLLGLPLETQIETIELLEDDWILDRR